MSLKEMHYLIYTIKLYLQKSSKIIKMKKYGTMNFKDIKKFIKKFSLNSFNSKNLK